MPDAPLTRAPIVEAIAALPEEAFGFLCGWLVGIGRTAGGFQPPSRAALEALGRHCDTYLRSRTP